MQVIKFVTIVASPLCMEFAYILSVFFFHLVNHEIGIRHFIMDTEDLVGQVDKVDIVGNIAMSDSYEMDQVSL